MNTPPVPAWTTRTPRPEPDLTGVTTVVCSYSAIAGVPAKPITPAVFGRVLAEHGYALSGTDLAGLGPALHHHSAAPTRTAAADLVRWILALYRPEDQDTLTEEVLTAIAHEVFARTPDTPVGAVGRTVVLDLLDAGFAVTVATNTLRPWSQRRDTLDEAGLDPVGLITSSDLDWAKPDLRFYAHTLGRLDTSPGRVLWVGPDEQRDVTGPQRAGMRALKVRSALDDRLDPWSRTPLRAACTIGDLPDLLGVPSHPPTVRGA